MSDATVLSSKTAFWGRRYGQMNIFCPKDGTYCNGFKQMQWGNGSSHNRPAFRTGLKNIPRKWFGRIYRSKRG